MTRASTWNDDQMSALLKLLRDPNVSLDVHKEAVSALQYMGEAVLKVPALGSLIRDPNVSPYVRQAVALALANIGGEAARDQVPTLGSLLRDPKVTDSVRAAAANALGNIGEAARDQVPTLGNLLNDPYVSSDVRAAVARALGNMGEAARDQAPALGNLLRDPKEDDKVRAAAAEALGNMGEAARDQASALGNLLRDPNVTYGVRREATLVLGNMGEAARDQAPALLKLLSNSKQEDDYVRLETVTALEKMGPLGMESILSILSNSYANTALVGEMRFLAHLLGGGEQDIEILIAWLGKPARTPIETLQKNHEQAVKTLQVFKQAWGASEPFLEVRQDLATQIAKLAINVEWEKTDLPLLRAHEQNLKQAGLSQADTLDKTIKSYEAIDWLANTGKVWLAHALFWLALVFLYPQYSPIQAIFFWNPWVRRFIGLGYVGFLLTWVPYLRAKLFAPFRNSLRADAALESFDSDAYFKDSQVKIVSTGLVQPLIEAIPSIKGQAVLEGESGIGKTMFLRYLVQQSKRIVVYLSAEKCVGGVMEAIQAKLHGQAQDADFLRSLIYAGAIDICIDGLNEVSPDTCAKITLFAESYFKGNIIIGTQPLEWTPPATAKIYAMQPLSREHIKAFLLTWKTSLPDDSQVTGAAYEQTCLDYLAQTLDAPQTPENPEVIIQPILSNPMDLTVVAIMLAHSQQPDLFRLQEQQYHIMADDYKRVNIGQDFPLKPFSERVYQMRLHDQTALPAQEFLRELHCMERHKMVVARQLAEDKGASVEQWYFRHDKIMDFFIVQAFMGPDDNRLQQHLGDPRFRGVYFQLAKPPTSGRSQGAGTPADRLRGRYQGPYGKRFLHQALALQEC